MLDIDRVLVKYLFRRVFMILAQQCVRAVRAHINVVFYAVANVAKYVSVL
jgi:hypothetical protein